jgi:hypothetical protein
MASSSPGTEGITLSLPTTGRPPHAQWRMASFSIALPVPPSSLPTYSRDKHTIDLGPQWIPGHFPGIYGIEVPATGDDIQRESRSTPRAWTSNASSWFASPLKESVGAGKDTKHVFRHLNLDDSCALTAELAGRGHTSISRDTADISLAGVEFLQFRGNRAHDGVGTEIELCTDYLVLHIIVENCSSAMLEAVSGALHRPNQSQNKLALSPTDKATIDPTDQDRLLEVFLAAAEAELNTGFPVPPGTPTTGDQGFNFTLSKGGYLETKDHAGTLQRGPVDIYRIVASRTIRSISAIPYDSKIDLPSLFKDLPTSGNDRWSASDMWAWSLSAGSDRYAEGTPDPRSDTNGDLLPGNYLHWATAASPHGIAVVRRTQADNCDTKPWRLAATHFLWPYPR